jgi:alpha-N-acetylglucosaminidase
MMSHYYKPRWQLFVDYLNKSLTDKTPFNQNDYNKEVFNKVELKFVNQNQSFPTQPIGLIFGCL